MKKWIVILSLSLLLTGCQAVTDTAGKTESFFSETELVRFTLLEDYQVEDILYFSGEWSYHMKVLLKDGSVIELQSESWG